MSKIDPLELRNAFGKFMTGVTVVTTITDDGTPIGFTANSFSSVSLAPPLLLVCPAKSISCFNVFAECNYFHINVLAHDQQTISNTFASLSGDRFKNIGWQYDANGCPQLDGAIASFSCRRDRSIDAGDHIILLGEVTHFSSNEIHGLGYREGSYFSLELERKAAEVQHTQTEEKLLIAGALIEHQNKLLVKTSNKGLALPHIKISDGQPSFDLLEHHLTELIRGNLSIGSVFSIFDHQQSNTTSIYYCVTLDDESPISATEYQFQTMSSIDLDQFESKAVRSMVQRFIAEQKSGNHSLYIGDEKHGRTHKIGGTQL